VENCISKGKKGQEEKKKSLSRPWKTNSQREQLVRRKRKKISVGCGKLHNQRGKGQEEKEKKPE